jgi:glucosyl-dolichyl phosphate glucuronosyltransferase
MTVSVIIATYNRETLLRECLEALVQQPFHPGDEVIVVDNGSTDGTATVVAACQPRCPVPLRYLVEPTPGKSHALTRALAVSQGDTLAFTDDDVVVDEAWLDAIRAAFKDASLMLVAGRVDPRWEHPAPSWLEWQNPDGTFTGFTAPLAILHYGEAQDLGPRAAVGANMAIRRSALVAIGGFPSHLGKLRGTLLSGEDHYVCRLIAARGLRARYVPSVCVRHRVPASRLRLAYYLRWFFWSGIANATLEGSHRSGTRYWLMRLAAECASTAAAAVMLRRSRAAEHAAHAAVAVGYLAERWRVVSLPRVEATEALPA